VRAHVIVVAAIVAAASIPTTALASAPASVEQTCVRHDLPVPPGAVSSGFLDTDPTGRYQLGLWYPATGEARVVVWKDGVPSDRGPQAGANGSSLISSRGEIVGADTTGERRNWRLRNGVKSWLPAPSGALDVLPREINRRGEIAGQYSLSPFGPRRALVWRPDNRYRLLPVPPSFDDAFPTAIDDSGAVLGVVGNGTQTQAIVWLPGGAWRLLPPVTSTYDVYPHDLRRGLAAGTIGGAPAIWNVALGKYRTLAGKGILQHVNARRSVVGRVDDRDVLITRSGVVRPIKEAGDTGYLTVQGLDDNDTVYGWDYGTSEFASKWTCR
jgi:hypothetical protein